MTEAAMALRAAFGERIDQFTFVPVPPSKSKADPDYDDRMVRILTQMGNGTSIDIRDLVEQTHSMAPSHEAENDGASRASVDELIASYSVDSALCSPTRPYLAVVDDVITTGRHFLAMKKTLQTVFPNVPVIGVFIARSVHDATTDFEGIFPEC